MVTIPSTTGNVGDLLSHQFATQKRNNQQALLQILSSIKFLCRQGLPLRGDGDESDGNLMQVGTVLLNKHLLFNNVVDKYIALKLF